MLALARGEGLVLQIEAKLALARGLVGPVALEAMLRQDRADLFQEVDGAILGARCASGLNRFWWKFLAEQKLTGNWWLVEVYGARLAVTPQESRCLKLNVPSSYAEFVGKTRCVPRLELLEDRLDQPGRNRLAAQKSLEIVHLPAVPLMEAGRARPRSSPPR